MKNLLNLLFVLPFLFSCGGNEFDVSSFVPNATFEFRETSIAVECVEDPTIITINVIDDKTAKIHLKHTGCPSGGVTEDELIYSYKIDESTNWNQEYDWLKTDPKVIILENNNAGYYNGHMFLAKRYMISNAYDKDEFIEARIFNQLDPEEYPMRNGVFSGCGGLHIE